MTLRDTQQLSPFGRFMDLVLAEGQTGELHSPTNHEWAAMVTAIEQRLLGLGTGAIAPSTMGRIKSGKCLPSPQRALALLHIVHTLTNGQGVMSAIAGNIPDGVITLEHLILPKLVADDWQTPEPIVIPYK